MALSSPAAMGSLVSTAAKKEKGQGPAEEAEVGGGDLQILRRYGAIRRWCVVIAAAICCSGLHAGVHLYGKGAELVTTTQFAEVPTFSRDGNQANLERSAETSEQAPQRSDKDQQQGESSGERRRKMELMVERAAGHDLEGEKQARRDAAKIEEGTRGSAKGRGADQKSEGRGGSPGRRRTSGEGSTPKFGSDGRCNSQRCAEEDQRRCGARAEDEGNATAPGKRICAEVEATEEDHGATVYEPTGPRSGTGGGECRGRRRDGRWYSEAPSFGKLWCSESACENGSIAIQSTGKRTCQRISERWRESYGDENVAASGNSRGGSYYYVDDVNEEMDVKQDVASGSGGKAFGLAVHLQGMVGRDTFVCLEKILFGVTIDIIVFTAVVLMIVLMHRENRQEVIVIEGRRYFRPCKVKEKKYNRNGIWLLLLVLGQHGVMAAELNKEGHRIGTLYRSNHVEDSGSNALMQQSGRPVPTTGVPEDDGDPTGGSGSSDDERQIRIHAFMRVKAYTLIHCGESETELVSLIAEANIIGPEEVMALHEVFHPPAHLNIQPHDHVFIGELRRDAVHRLTSDDVLCLFSIEFQNPSRLYDVQTRLQVQWTSNWMNREDILHFIRIAELCRMRVHPVTCMTWLNNRFLAEDSTARHEIKDGDMIRILVQSPTHASVHELICNLREAERVQRNRVFYLESSSEEDSTSENGEEEEAEVEASGSEEVEEPRRSRSRSRDREEGEGVELLQRSVKKLVRRKGVTVVNWSPGNEEESTWEPGSNKTLFRRSPLDTFVSNFERLAPPGNPQQQKSTACRISLHDALFGQDTIVISDGEEEDEGERIRVNDANIKLHENHAGFLSLLQSWSGEGNGLRLDMPDNFDPCPVAFQFLCRCVEGPSSRIEELHIYTDSSYNPKEGNATFAAGIFGYDSSREPRHFFLGWLGDRVVEDPEHGHYIGARMQSSEEAEASGLLWAHLWLLQFPGTWDVTFHYDSLTVGNAMQGQWNTRDGWLQGQRLRDIALLCKSAKRLHAINYEHCKAHSNQPCNEFVDAVAKALGKTLVKEATTTWIVAKHDPSLFVAEDQRLQWAWWHIDVLFDPVLPKWCDGELKVEAPRENWSTQGVTAIEHSNKGSLGKVEFSLKVVSYNVMTLHSVNEDGKHQSEAGRAEFLRQFDYFKVHAIGLHKKLEVVRTRSLQQRTTSG